MSANLLELHQLRVAYGGINAVKGIDLAVAEGAMVCLIGANGAGKTSTLRAIAGLVPVDPESVHLYGRAVGGTKPHELVRLGLALVPEGRGIFAQLTVAENLAMGAYARSDRHAVQTDLQRMYELFPRLAERRRQIAGTLSGGEQQMLAIARALMSKPRLLLLDEPSMGLAPLIVARIFEILARIAAEGVTLLLVEQNARLALETCHTGYVMESGLITLHDTAAALLGNDRVRQAYLGE